MPEFIDNLVVELANTVTSADTIFRLNIGATQRTVFSTFSGAEFNLVCWNRKLYPDVFALGENYEQVTVTNVNLAIDEIIVRRGQRGTRAIPLEAGTYLFMTITSEDIKDIHRELAKKQNAMIPEYEPWKRTNLPLLYSPEVAETTYFDIKLSESQAFSMSQSLLPYRTYCFLVKNVSTADITVKLPVDDLKPVDAITLPAGKAREIQVYNNSLRRVWKISEELI